MSAGSGPHPKAAAETDFSLIESYDWLPVPPQDPGTTGIGDNRQVHAWVTDAVDTRLAEQGLRLDPDEPDLLLGYDVPIEMRGTLTLAELSRDTSGLDLDTVARGIVLAAVSNTLVKGGIVLGMGSMMLRKVIMPGLLATLATAIGVVFIL